MRDYYAYILLDPTKEGEFNYTLDNGYTLFLPYEPFYAGKGKGLRSGAHIREAIYGIKKTSRSNEHKLNRINKISKAGAEPVSFHVKDKLTEKKAFEWEISIISCIGRRDLKTGPLTNWSGGGEGVGDLSPETIKKHSEAQKRHRASLTFADNVIRSMKISQTVTERWNALSEEERAAHAGKTKKHWESLSPKQQEKAMQGFRKGYKSWLASLTEEGRKAALGTGSKMWWASMSEADREAHSQKTGEGIRRFRAAQTAEERAAFGAKLSLVKRANIAAKSPEDREAMREQRRKAIAERTPEQRAEIARKAREGQMKAAVQCPHCPIRHFNKKMMERYHFDNCKHA